MSIFKNGVKRSTDPILHDSLLQQPVVVKVLDRVHGEPGKRFDVGVSVVESVHILVHRLDVDEPVSKVEVELSVEGNPESCNHEQRTLNRERNIEQH